MEQSTKPVKSVAERIAVAFGWGIGTFGVIAALINGSRDLKILLELFVAVILGFVTYYVVWGIGVLIARTNKSKAWGYIFSIIFLGIVLFVAPDWFNDAPDKIAIVSAVKEKVSPQPTPTLEQRFPVLFGNAIEQQRCENQDPYLKIWPSIVKVTVQTLKGQVQGTGFVVDGDGGYILTATHVVADAQTGGIEVTFRNGVSQRATAITQYEVADISLLRTDPIKFPPLKIGQNNAPGISVSAIGYAEDSYINAPGQIERVAKDNTGWANIITDIQAKRGMSGGPLVNNCGELLGILSFGRSGSGAVAISLSKRQVDNIVASANEDTAPSLLPARGVAPLQRTPDGAKCQVALINLVLEQGEYQRQLLELDQKRYEYLEQVAQYQVQLAEYLEGREFFKPSAPVQPNSFSPSDYAVAEAERQVDRDCPQSPGKLRLNF